MSIRIKICGITRLSDALHCAAVGVDMLGFNFYPASPRFIAPREAQKIIDRLPASVLPVGLLVRPTRKALEQVVQETGVRMVQLYGFAEREAFADLQIPLILPHAPGSAWEMPQRLAGVRYLLLDAALPGRLGGTGTTFDWNRIPATLPREILMLAGGLNPQNVQKAIEQVRPAAVDVASGVEQSPGRKDPQRVAAFVSAVRAAEKRLKEMAGCSPPEAT